MTPIYLIGFAGVGKTTLGEAVSIRSGVRFVDLDQYIEQALGMSVREIFAQKGEAFFRQTETQKLKELSENVIDGQNSNSYILIACGGGTPCFAQNMDYMLRSGKTVWLQAQEERLHIRLKDGRAQRPLIASKTDEEILDYIRETLISRSPFYSRAEYVFDTSCLDTLEQVEETSRKFIKEFMP